MEAGKGFTTGYRLSPIQERIWSCQRLAECQPYRSHGVLSLEGHVDTEKLRKALRHAVARHEILRSAFPRQPGMNSPFQTVFELDHFSWAVADLSAIELSEQKAELEKLFAEGKRSLFSLEAGPTWHALLVRLRDDRQMLILSLSALAADAATVKLLCEEIAADYSADSSSSGEIMQYVDVSEWHHELLESDETRAGRNYWRDLWHALNARAVAALSLPFEKSQSREVEFTPDLVPLPLDERLAAKIAASVKSHGLTSAEFLLGLWHMLLWRLTGQRDVTVGVMFDGRRHQELKRTLGPLSKYLPVHSGLTADSNLHDALKRIAENSRESSQWQDTFSWNSVENPVSTFFPFAFEYLELGEEVKAGELRMRLVNLSSSTERFKVKLVGLHRPEGLSLELHYDRSRYGRRAIARLGEQLALLCESALARPEQPASELEIVSGGERQRLLVEWNQSERAYPAGETIASLFQAQAHKTPERVAVVGSGQAMSYGELERRANRLAHLLQRGGVGADGLVGLCLERSPELVVGILGVLKAGGAYVPLSAEQPKVRLAQQLAGAQALVSESSRLRQLPEFPGVTVCFDRDAGLLAEQPETSPCRVAKAEHLVYVIYTSGSTGVPKGVEIEHRNLVNYARFMAERLRLEEYAEGLQFATVSTIAADLGNSCIYPALLSGGTIHLVSYEMAGDAARLGRYVQEQGIDVLKIVPSHLAALVAGEEGGQVLPRKYLITGGEALSGRLLERIAQFEAKCQVINHYGPTETTVGSLTFAVGEAKRGEWESAPVPIGRPIANTRVYILDGKRQAVPVGVVGELYIAGSGVGRGYRNQPEMTAERFLADPFVAEARMYRTGDLARYREDGAVEFLGRADDQVKVRGYRLELGEIEAVLAAHGNVKQAVVLAREDSTTGEKRLAGYVVLRQPAATVEELRQHLREHLPEYMVPAALVRLDKLPLNANGKVDRQALPAPEAAGPGDEDNYVAPRTALEQEVARIWAEVLRRQRVGMEDNFFDLGGHSLLATQVISRLRRGLGVELPLRAIFETPTIEKLAARIEAERKTREGIAPPPPIKPSSRDEPLPLSFAQQRLWFLDQLQPNHPLYNIPRAIRIRGRVHVRALERSLQEIVRRHESQRTLFKSVRGQPALVILPSPNIELRVIDLGYLPDSQREPEAKRLAVEEAERPFDLAKGPLLRASLLRIAEEESVLLLNTHHIVSDAWSATVMLEELGTLYEAFSTGKPSPLPELLIQYADFAAWQRQWLQGEVLSKQLAYWRKVLESAPAVLELPADRPRPPRPSFQGAFELVALPIELIEKLKVFSRRQAATLFMTLLAAFEVLLSRYSAQEQIVVGTDSANRTRLETERLIGFFVNVLPIRGDMSGDPPFDKFLCRIKEAVLGAYAHQEVPFDKIVEELEPERSMSHNPLVQVLFVMQNTPRPAKTSSSLQFDFFDIGVMHSKFDLAVFMVERGDELVGSWLYSTDLFEPATIRRIASHYETLLGSILEQPSRRISALEIMSESEIRQRAGEKDRIKSRLKEFLGAKPHAVRLSEAQSASED